MPFQYRIRLTPRAIADLDEINAFVFARSPQGAAKVMSLLLEAIDSLDTFPNRNVVQRSTAELKFPVRSLPVRPYVIYFHVIEEEHIVVVRHIRHGARQAPDEV